MLRPTIGSRKQRRQYLIVLVRFRQGHTRQGRHVQPDKVEIDDTHRHTDATEMSIHTTARAKGVGNKNTVWSTCMSGQTEGLFHRQLSRTRYEHYDTVSAVACRCDVILKTNYIPATLSLPPQNVSVPQIFSRRRLFSPYALTTTCHRRLICAWRCAIRRGHSGVTRRSKLTMR